MLAKELMSEKPDYLPPTATLKEAAEHMKKGDFGFIPVGENDRLIGAITDRDLTIRAIAQGKDPSKTQIREVMSKGIQFCFESDDIEDVTNKMETLQIRRIVVLDQNKRMTGVISLGDIATKSKDRELCGELTECVSKD